VQKACKDLKADPTVAAFSAVAAASLLDILGLGQVLTCSVTGGGSGFWYFSKRPLKEVSPVVEDVSEQILVQLGISTLSTPGYNAFVLSTTKGTKPAKINSPRDFGAPHLPTLNKALELLELRPLTLPPAQQQQQQQELQQQNAASATDAAAGTVGDEDIHAVDQVQQGQQENQQQKSAAGPTTMKQPCGQEIGHLQQQQPQQHDQQEHQQRSATGGAVASGTGLEEQQPLRGERQGSRHATICASGEEEEQDAEEVDVPPTQITGGQVEGKRIEIVEADMTALCQTGT
jgi:hypothetical protein